MAFGITLASVMVAALLVGLAILRAQRDAPHLFEPATPGDGWRLSVDDAGLRVRGPKEEFRELAWSDVGAVVVRSSDLGPAGPRTVSWRFDSASGGPALLVPAGSHGIEDLLAALPARFTGFDYRATLESMRAADLTEAEAWRREA